MRNDLEHTEPEALDEQELARRRREFGTFAWQVVLTGILNARGYKVRCPEAPTPEEREEREAA